MDFTLLDFFFFFFCLVFRIPGTRAINRILAMFSSSGSSSAFKEDDSFASAMSVS